MPETRSKAKNKPIQMKKNNVTITLKSSGKSKLYYGDVTNIVYEMRFYLKDWDNDGNKISDIEKAIKETLHKNKDYDAYEYALNGDFYSNNMQREGWFLSKWSDLDDLTFYTGRYVLAGAYLRRFDVLIRKPYNPFITKVGEDEHNDCLFKCIARAHNFDKHMLPKKINAPHKFKKYFGYERDERVDLFTIVDELETMLKCKINVSGDISRESALSLPKCITLKLKNNHVDLLCNKGKSMTKGLKMKAVKEDKLIFYMYKDDNVVIFDSCGSLFPFTDKMEITKFQEMKEEHMGTHLFIKCDENTRLDKVGKTVRDMYIKKANYFLKHTTGFLNYFKSPHKSLLALEVWRLMSKNISESMPLLDIEHYACDQANSGGVHYASVGKFEGCIDYDMNAMYMFEMSQLNFTFPTTQGLLQSLSQSQLDERNYFPYGLYLCKMTGASKWIPHEFVGRVMWQTHFMLTLAKEEGYQIAIKQGEINHIAYPTGRLNGNIAFKAYADWAFNLRNTVTEEYKDEAKGYTSCLWGSLTTKNMKTKRFGKDEPLNMSAYNIDQLNPNDNGGYTIRYCKKRQIFKYNYARIGCFLTSYCRLKLYQILKKANLEPIALNTDGFILQNQQLPEELIGTEPGKFKVVHQGTVTITNSNSYKFT